MEVRYGPFHGSGQVSFTAVAGIFNFSIVHGDGRSSHVITQDVAWKIQRLP